MSSSTAWLSFNQLQEKPANIMLHMLEGKSVTVSQTSTCRTGSSPLARDLDLHGLAHLHGVLELLVVELEHEHIVLAVCPVVRVFKIRVMRAVTEASRDLLGLGECRTPH